MAKGAEGKAKVIAKIAEAFGTDYIGEVDKKVYVWTTENGERIQIAIALTCPKVMVDCADTGAPIGVPQGDFNFEDGPGVVTAPVKQVTAAEISETEKQNIADLMARLGL